LNRRAVHPLESVGRDARSAPTPGGPVHPESRCIMSKPGKSHMSVLAGDYPERLANVAKAFNGLVLKTGDPKRLWTLVQEDLQARLERRKQYRAHCDEMEGPHAIISAWLDDAINKGELLEREYADKHRMLTDKARRKAKHQKPKLEREFLPDRWELTAEEQMTHLVVVHDMSFETRLKVNPWDFWGQTWSEEGECADSLRLEFERVCEAYQRRVKSGLEHGEPDGLTDEACTRLETMLKLGVGDLADDHGDKGSQAARTTDDDGGDDGHASKSYTVAALVNLTDADSRTLNRYAKRAGVKTPGPGKRNHTYTLDEARQILEAMAQYCTQQTMRGKAERALQCIC